jgi:hypothetical protein
MVTPTIVASRDLSPRILRQKLDSAIAEGKALEERNAYLEGLVRDAYDALTGDMDVCEHEVIVGRLRAVVRSNRG